VFGTPRHDALRQCRTDARQSCDFAHVGVIEIDALTRQEWTGKLRRATRSLAQATRRNDGGRLKSNVTGRIAWRRRQHKSNPGACQGQACQQERGAAIVHRRNLSSSDEWPASKKCGGQEKNAAVKSEGVGRPPQLLIDRRFAS